nr:MAG TPA: hypothetical protein [Caudoviricetes sp.]
MPAAQLSHMLLVTFSHKSMFHSPPSHLLLSFV